MPGTTRRRTLSPRGRLIVVMVIALLLAVLVHLLGRLAWRGLKELRYKPGVSFAIKRPL